MDNWPKSSLIVEVPPGETRFVRYETGITGIEIIPIPQMSLISTDFRHDFIEVDEKTALVELARTRLQNPESGCEKFIEKFSD